ncbi:uncharacterized protein [Clytia hemisphaerica]|uniref:Uncharacterized protein n=1 Tax=Clytia hemisphaerica TaxID=252671 RepID=A0A7M5UT78_9CNID
MAPGMIAIIFTLLSIGMPLVFARAFIPGTYCKIDDVEFHHRNTHIISQCTYCTCNETTEEVSCYKWYKGPTESRLQTLCENCTSLPVETDCSYCENPSNSSQIVSSGQSLTLALSDDCISCQCTLEGSIKCRYHNSTMCEGLSCDNYIKYQIPYISCDDGCTDPATGIQKPEGSWITSEGVSCDCLKSHVTCTKFEFIESYLFLIKCDRCTVQDYKEQFYEKDCLYNGQILKHGKTSPVQIYNIMGCASCVCFMGEIQCKSTGFYTIGTFPDILNFGFSHTCTNAEECKALEQNNDIKIFCSRNPALASCTGIYDWKTDYCQLNCSQIGERPSYTLIDKTWCGSLPELRKSDCDSMCPDRFDYMKEYGSALVSCNSTDQLIWKDQLCDGKQNCINGEDEQDCLAYYCPYVYDNFEVLWKSVGAGENFETQCDQIPILATNFSQYGLKGKVSRSCTKFNYTSEPLWDNLPDCGCTIDGFPKLLTDEEDMTYELMDADITLVHQHYNISPSSIQHFNVIMQYLNLTLKMLRHDNSSEGNFVYQTEEWRRKNYHFIDHMMKSIAVMSQSPRFCVEEQHKQMDYIFLTLIPAYKFNTHGYKANTVSLMRGLKGIGKEDLLTNKAVEMAKEDFSLRRGKLQMGMDTEGKAPKIKSPLTTEMASSIKLTTLDTLEEVLSAISIVSLGIGLIAFRLVRNQTMRLFNHQNLMLSFLLNGLIYKIPLWFISNLPSKSQGGCMAVSVLSYFFTLCSFSWMMVEGINIVIIMVFVFQWNGNYHKQYTA